MLPLFACLLVSAAVLSACGASGASAASSSGATGAAYTQPSSVTVPPANADGIDISGVDEGWVCASANSASRLKFQVINGDMTYNYDLPNDGTSTLFPINMGDGSYSFRIMQNTEGKMCRSPLWTSSPPS